jgi:hypothetical protein
MERTGNYALRQNAFVEELERRAAALGIRREPEKFTIGSGDHQRRGRGFRGIKSIAPNPF